MNNEKDIIIDYKNLLILKDKIEEDIILKNNEKNKKINEDCNMIRNTFINLLNNDLIKNYKDMFIISEDIKLNLLNYRNFEKECKININEIENNIKKNIGFNVNINLHDFNQLKKSNIVISIRDKI